MLFFVDRAVKYQQAHQDTNPHLYKDSNNNQHIIFKKRFWVAVDIIQRSYHFYKLRVDYVFSLTNYWPLIKEALIKYDNNHFWVADDDSDCPNITRMNEACRSLCDYLYQRIDTDISDNEIDEELKELPQPIRRSARVAQNVKDGKGIPPPLPPKLESWHHIIRVCQMAKAKIEETMDPDNNENSQVMENIRAINNAYKSWSKRCYDHIYIVQLMQPVIAAMNRRKYLTDSNDLNQLQRCMLQVDSIRRKIEALLSKLSKKLVRMSPNNGYKIKRLRSLVIQEMQLFENRLAGGSTYNNDSNNNDSNGKLNEMIEQQRLLCEARETGWKKREKQKHNQNNMMYRPRCASDCNYDNNENSTHRRCVNCGNCEQCIYEDRDQIDENDNITTTHRCRRATTLRATSVAVASVALAAAAVLAAAVAVVAMPSRRPPCRCSTRRVCR